MEKDKPVTLESFVAPTGKFNKVKIYCQQVGR